jgi:S-adenosylmethionine-diacylgycerolhomoserine-N-methlytransferase
MYDQMDKTVAQYAEKFGDYITKHQSLKSYFYTGYLNGEWDERSLPLYLKKEWYEIVRSRLSRVHIITGCLDETVRDCANHPKLGFTHVNLLDSMDWMTDTNILKQMKTLRRVCCKDAKICFRSASETQPFTCLRNQFIKSKNIWQDTNACIDRVGMYQTIHVMKFNDNMPILIPKTIRYQTDIVQDITTLFNMIVPKFSLGEASSAVNNSTFLDSFYGNQAAYYDNYRSRMLHGKEPMMNMIPYFNGMSMLLFGGGTGDLYQYVPPNIKIHVTCVDLCLPLLEIARQNYPDMCVVHADAEKYVSQKPYDFVLCTYALTMIPNWKRAIENMVQSCKVGGLILCSDFTVDGKNPVRDQVVQFMFSKDNVNLTKDHMLYLDNHRQLKRVRLCIEEGDFPYITKVYKSSYYYGSWQKCL